jgi:V/A-type H+/Na+-transporting ATPase subunit D
MPKLSKSNLQLARTQLKLYKRLLPSLDMKRRQLTIEHEKAMADYSRARQMMDHLNASIGEELPMLGGTDIVLDGLAHLATCKLGEENVVGVRLPVLREIDVKIADYSRVARPTWVDLLAQRLKQSIEQQMRVNVSEKRLIILAKSLRQITQRVNLFERILIPEAKKTIRRIRIFLGDLERDAVVRSKLAKSHSANRVSEVHS